MKSLRSLARILGVAALAALSADAVAQRSIKVDDGLWVDNTCDQPGLIGGISGNSVTLNGFVLEGYKPGWGSTPSTFCEEVVGKLAADLYDVDPVVRALLGSGTASGRRYTFTSEANPSLLGEISLGGFPADAADIRYGFQWEIWYFNDAIIASLAGPIRATPTPTADDFNVELLLADSSTFLDGTDDADDRGGLTSRFDINFLCFDAAGSEFNGIFAASDLGQCRAGGGGDDTGGGGGGGTVVPLPGTLGLLGIGLAGLGFVRRRR